MKIPYLDLREKNSLYRKKLLGRFNSILKHGKIINGPEVKEFEYKISRYLNKKYTVGLGSGSSALYLALRSLDIGPGDEVITTPFTWIITINAILQTGAKPKFADIGDDLNINPNSVENLITRKTKAIVPMHVGGHMCDMIKISKIAKKYKLHIVEDAAQAICSSLNGKKAGDFSKVSAFSLNPMKVLNAYGECGFVGTDSNKLKKKILMLRHAGTAQDKKKIKINNCYYPSLNHKIDTLQASLVLENLKILKNKWRYREKIARIYDSELKNLINIQEYHKDEIHGRYLYIFTCENRNKLFKNLKKRGIECKIFYSPLASEAPIFKNSMVSNIKNSRKLIKKTLSIPLHEDLKANQVSYIVNAIKKFYR